MFALYLIGVILLLGLCVMLVSIRNAPRGFEDESGFHEVLEPKAAADPVKTKPRDSVVTKPLVAR